jgi:hypothetical protein
VVENMSKKNQARHQTNSQITAETAVISTDDNTPNMPMRKPKEDAEQILYIKRV